jgi:6-phosphogluconolactonase/glucosamine-6-phosphate isomerase/deaminase
MTFSAILSEKKLIVLLKGKDKKAMLDELLNGEKTEEEFPAKRLLEHDNVHIFYLEK